MAAPSAPDAPRPADLDTGTLSLLAGFAAADLVQAALAREGFGDLRFSHGYVFQQLVAADPTVGDPTVGDLAAALGMTQQGASKAVAELEGLGYTERVPDPRDARVRRVRLTPRGRAAVEAARRARADLEDRLARRWGAGRLAEVRELLAGLLEETGGADAVRRRQVLPPR
ncbi:MarR family winged helix-turn-helix transcriptional regulator [Streptomyces sp. NPDC001380]|uniref:MarR family winged helix-turn-helix transcriptional regulator n=1 Tax=Streptomyces sp. NPDC001380 TaxID=3364566 RepID=UPI00368B9EB7